ncbi:MAG: DNA polymerase III subunit gamma/tau [Planctomycetota bacterium]
MDNEAEVDATGEGYTVVARRYRPKSFGELIGQDHISQALNRAISSGRVGHAYLFTGARGVGKTSTARIFAKALNIPDGSSEEHATEIAQAIDSGEDIDVIEIDGASNRGIEEIRQLRANVNVRPSRSVYKIYIIDEVHMLTNQAFNALLKTLEEPPPHVKFIFCTTDPDKIPITVLSRCQRFDFAPVQLEAIQGRLKEISECEGYQADDEALALLARRAAGSMRDSQSLLEQVMSFSVDRITVDQVHDLLGTADESRLQAFAEVLMQADRLKAIQLVDEAVRAGADAGQLAEQLLGYLRDLMAVAVGGGADLLKLANPVSHGKLKEMAEAWGLHTVLAAVQILDESLVRMRSSISAVTLLEVALVQICELEQIASIPDLLERLQSGQLAKPAPQKKKAEVGGLAESFQAGAAKSDSAKPAASAPQAHSPAPSEPVVNPAETPSSTSPATTVGEPQSTPSNPTPAQPVSAGVESTPTANSTAPPSSPVSSNSPAQTKTQHAPPPAPSAPAAPPRPPSSSGGDSYTLQQWKQGMAAIDGMLCDFACMAEEVEALDSGNWKVTFPAGGTQAKEYCEQPDKKSELQKALQQHLGRSISVVFHVRPGQPVRKTAVVSKTAQRQQRMREISNDPYVKRLCEVLDGEIVRVDPPKEPQAGNRNGSANVGS